MSRENLTQLATFNKQNFIDFSEKNFTQSSVPNFGDTPKNLVQQDCKGIVTTTTLRIAEIFGKRHCDILRDIKRLLSQLPKEFNERNFAESNYSNNLGMQYPMYTLTRDAFSLLVMGFTGEKALQWKLKYIEAFNSMEQACSQKDIELAKEISYQQGIEYGQSLPCVQIETKKSYLSGLEEGRKIQKREDNWKKMEKALEYLGKGLTLKDTANLVHLRPGTIRDRFRRLGLWEQVKNGDLWFNMPGKKQKDIDEQPQQLSLL